MIDSKVRFQTLAIGIWMLLNSMVFFADRLGGAATPSWELKSVSVSPPARAFFSMAFDEARGQIVLFGGFAGSDATSSSSQYFNDTWVWDGSKWEQKTVSAAPAPRFGHAMTYDTAHQQVVLFGGGDMRGSGALYNDTWVWNGSQWTHKSQSVSPSIRTWNAMAYDAARQQVVLFGGFDGIYTCYSDTWTWDGSQWEKKTVSSAPAGRAGHVMTYDSLRNRVMLFGGSGDDNYSDTWTWDGSQWEKKSTSVAPSARYWPGMGFDASRGEMVLFGGSDDNQYFSDTWTWDSKKWEQKTVSNKPSARAGQAIAYDSLRHQTILYGGGNEDAGYFYNDTWFWNGGTASPVPTISGITPSSGTPGVTIPAFTVSGNNFTSTSVLSFSGSGITVNSYGTRSSKQFITSISIAADAIPGMRDVNVTNPEGQSATLANAFSVEAGCIAPTISMQPLSCTIESGGTVTLHVAVAGTAPMNYQWYEGPQGDTARPVGANDAAFTSPTLAASTSYWVRILNNCGQTDSQTAMITVQPSSIQWNSIGPEGGWMTAIVVDPSNPQIIFAATYGGGIFKSTAGGRNWSAMNSGLTTLQIACLTIDPSNPLVIYAGTYYGGVFRSTTGGDRWSAVNSGLPTASVRSLVIDPMNHSIIYAGTFGDGVFKTTTRGDSWSAANSGLSNLYISSLVLDQSNSSILYAGTFTEGVFKSTTAGANWGAVNSGLSNLRVSCLVIDPSNSSILYAGTSSGGIYKSSTGGSSWSTTNSGLPFMNISQLVFNPSTPSIIYASTYGGGVFKSTPEGNGWTASTSGLNTDNVTSLAVDPSNPNTIYAGTWGNGVFKSMTAASSWSAVNIGLRGVNSLTIAIDPSNPAVIYSGSNHGGVFKSTATGSYWDTINSGLTDFSITSLVIDPTNSQIIYAATMSGDICKSTTGGNRWYLVQSGLGVYILAIDPTNSSIIYAGTYAKGIYKSSNGGSSWNAMSSGLTDLNVLALAIDSSNPSIVYAGTLTGGIFKSGTGGAAWTSINSGLTNKNIRSLAVDHRNSSILYAGTYGGGVFKSTNGGNSWVPVSLGLSTLIVQSLAIDPSNPSILYAGTFEGGVFKSTNGANSWIAVNSGLSNLDILSLAIDPHDSNKIYAGTNGSSVFVTSLRCNCAMNSVSASYSSSGIAHGQVQVTTSSACSWTALSNTGWIVITSGASGQGAGTVSYSLQANVDTSPRTGTITIAGQTFTIAQDGLSTPFSLSTILPNSGLITGGTAVTLQGAGFQVGASVTIGGVPAWISSLTSNQIVAVTGVGRVLGNYDVVVTNPGGHLMVLSHGFTYLTDMTLQTTTLFVPIVLSSAGASNSYYTSELTLTNRGAMDASLHLTYTAAIGSGSGSGADHLGAGQQRVIGDAIVYLRSLGIPIPSTGNAGGTLRITFSGLASPTDGAVTVRTTTLAPEGRAGLAYAGISPALRLTGPSYICGLRQNSTDRSNLALQHAGSAAEGNISLRLTVFSGDPYNPVSQVLQDQVLTPGGFFQISSILASNGLTLSNGYVRVERVSGTAPYYAYGVINDQVTSDGSFIAPVEESALAGKTRLTLPVMVEAGTFSTELVATNWSSVPRTLQCQFIADGVQTLDHTARFNLSLSPGQQVILPDYVQQLRSAAVSGIGARGGTFAGAVLVSTDTGDLSGIALSARVSASGGEGRYGLYYTAPAEGTTVISEAWLYGLQQNSENRTNLALVNTGEIDTGVNCFQIELYDGSTGQKVKTLDSITLGAGKWTQLNTILAASAPGVAQGYAHIQRTSGNNPFIAYAVRNDGSQSGLRSGDGAFVMSAP
jgi:hypothetical protein